MAHRPRASDAGHATEMQSRGVQRSGSAIQSFIDSKISGLAATTGNAVRRECNRERRETHGKKSTPSVEPGRESTEDNEGNEDAGRPFVLLVSLCSRLPGPHAERRCSVTRRRACPNWNLDAIGAFTEAAWFGRRLLTWQILKLDQMKLSTNMLVKVRCRDPRLPTQPGSAKIRNALCVRNAVEMRTPRAKKPTAGTLSDPEAIASQAAFFQTHRSANEPAAVRVVCCEEACLLHR